jgi:hypothetical protein
VCVCVLGGDQSHLLRKGHRQRHLHLSLTPPSHLPIPPLPQDDALEGPGEMEGGRKKGGQTTTRTEEGSRECVWGVGVGEPETQAGGRGLVPGKGWERALGKPVDR